MQNHAKSIKGMSIGALAVSGVLTVCYFLGAIGMGIASSVLGSSSMWPPRTSRGFDTDLDSLFNYYYGYGDIYGNYTPGMGDVQMVAAVFGSVVAIFVIAALLSAVTLVGSIIIMRNSDKPQKYGIVFGWSVAGAIIGFFTSGFVLTVLFILIAVFSNMDRKLYESGAYVADEVPAPQPVSVAATQQPVAGQPGPIVVPAVTAQPAPQPEPVAAAEPVEASAAAVELAETSDLADPIEVDAVQTDVVVPSVVEEGFVAETADAPAAEIEEAVLEENVFGAEMPIETIDVMVEPEAAQEDIFDAVVIDPAIVVEAPDSADDVSEQS